MNFENIFKKDIKKINIKRILKITDEFLKIPSIIEYEKPFLEYLNMKIKKLGYETNLKSKYLVVKPKKNKIENNSKNVNNIKNTNNIKKLFSIHIDRHGLILNENNQLEYTAYYFKKKYNLKFNRDTPEFFLSCCQRHTNDNIYSYNLKTGNRLNEYKITRYNLNYLKKEVTFQTNKKIKNINIEEIFAFKSKIFKQDNLFSGHIDNVISAAVMYYILENTNFENEIIFTTREEIGKSYENVIEYINSIDYKLKLIILDTSPYENFEKYDEGFLVLRKGDENGDFDLELVNKIKKTLVENNIPFNFKNSNNGMTELGRISSYTKGKINGITLQIPTLNYHTTYETSTIKSLENYTKTIIELNQNKF